MHSEIEEFTVCDVCGFAEARTRYGSRAYGKGKDLLVIENVPMVSCPSCGTSYLTSFTLKEIDRIKRDRKTVAVTKSVKVASFSV
ncbi:type II toxin-antitoxin system MqsA family antitoxin [Moorena producens JHB]|uniref:Type II toxin-antitoxin system MqsA family antitoxin n=1 Tax=Moorena producens (strain JHB) TaxID=1454205 RepID=A0A1D9G663_MOOP1|nr:type II toxin-antitoxin system MqsA family antitoxin [Moorena producens]AOY83132.1 type II toxin-antitoxin system MqsA family antitoxin [Moorena producens JHB]